jgi:nickel/cobalt transporter (NiCoT) family protein
LLAISASVGQQSTPFLGVMSFPIFFATGMSMKDTEDRIFMMRAYRRAFATPLRKVYYNLTITVIWVNAALFIGLIELAQVFSGKLGLANGFLGAGFNSFIFGMRNFIWLLEIHEN